MVIRIEIFFKKSQLIPFFVAVSSANWEAVYDIRVNLESKDHPLTLVYKAAIAQNTGEVCYSG